MPQRNRLVRAAGFVVSVVLTMTASFQCSAYAVTFEEISLNLEKIHAEFKLGQDPVAIKNNLLQLQLMTNELIGKDERARFIHDEINEALNQVQHHIIRKRPAAVNDRLILSSFLKKYSQTIQQAYSFRNLSSTDAIARNRELLKREIERLMGGFPEKAPLHPVVVEKIEFPDYIREKIQFDSEPGRSVIAYLLIPKNAKHPLPAIVCFHQHGIEYFAGKDGPVGELGGTATLDYALDLTRRGYVTLTIDAPCFGERCDDESDVGYLAGLVGRPLIGFVIYDDIRSVDYLMTRSEVDKDKVGCIGHSLGGTRAMYVSALDDRIKVSVSMNAFSDIKDLIETDRHRWPATTYLPGLLPFAEIEDLVCMSAPRPVLIAVSEMDQSLAFTNLEKHLAGIRRVFTLYDSAKSFKFVLFKDTVHDFPKQYHEEVYGWFDEHFKGTFKIRP